MRSLLRTCLGCVLLFLVVPFTFAQGAGSSGVLSGVVTDAQGAKVANAQVTVVQPERGVKRTATTDEHGAYRITSLAPDTYSVSIEAPGMARQTYDGVELRVGQFASVDVHLGMVTVKTEAASATAQPVVDTERASQADVISRRELQDLPANSRDYLSYAQLSPGVTDSTRIAGNLDYRSPQAPQSMISVNGSNGQGNGYTVNAGETANDLGGARLSAGQDAIQEFEINRSNYGAELGSAGFAKINAVPRSGSNRVHGGAFGFFQGDGMDARNPFAFDPALQPGDIFDGTTRSFGTPAQNDLSQQTFGASIGGPFQTDRTYYFFSYEGLRRYADASVPLLTDTALFAPTAGQQTIIDGLAGLGATPVPCLTGQPALPANTCAAILTNVLTIRNTPPSAPLDKYLVGLFESEGGLVSSSAGRDAGTIRLDHQLNGDNQLHFLYDLGRDDVSNPNLYGLTGASRGESFHQLDHTVLGSWDHQFSGAMNNELRAQFSYAKFDVTTNSPGQVGMDINGYGSFGRGPWGPSQTTMKRYDFADDFTWTKGRHTLRAGAELMVHDDRMDQQMFTAGRFEFGGLLGGVLSPCLQVPAACGINVSPTMITSLQAFVLGLPQSYQQSFGDRPGDTVVQNTNPLTAVYAQDSWKMFSNFTLNFGARYEYDSQPKPLNTYAAAFAPRVAFAWDPFQSHKTVIRGGYGIFYGPVDHQVDYAAQALSTNQVAQLYVPLNGLPGLPATTSAAVFQTLFAGGQVQCTTPSAGAPACITPADLVPFGLSVSHSAQVPGSIFWNVDPEFQNAMTQQGSFGVERQIWEGWTISANYLYAHTTHLARTRDINLLNTAPMSSFVGVPFQTWTGAPCLVPGNCFADPTLMQNNLLESRGGAVYHAGVFEVRKQFSNHYSLVANYTYSHAIDDVSGFNTDLQAFNQVALASERARSDFDQRHKFDFYMVAESPWTWRSSEGWRKVFADFVLSPEIVANSGHPYNTLLGFDLNHDRHETTDRFPGISRNAGLGPAFANINLRISRSFPVGEQFKLQLVAESFNLFNHSNFTSVNNIVMDPYNFTLPKNGCQMGNIQTASYACTSATDGRTLQFGARISF